MNYNGIVVINAKNANFNAGFDGLPRRLPNGLIFATDKALKYCIREYWSKKEPVFVQRSQEFHEEKDKDGNITTAQRYLTLEQNYCKKCNREVIPKDEKLIIEDLKKFIDIRMFGVVFAVDANISLTGPCQISYGVNRYENANIYSSSILSPYRNPSKRAEEAHQTTIGEESRADNVYYVYDVCLNMNSAKAQDINISDEDINKLKEALKYSVGEVNSTTMFGCETVSVFWFVNKEDTIFNNLNVLVHVKDEKEKVVVDYTKVMELIQDKIDTDSIEHFHNKVDNRLKVD
jgi:CRISPR-associated protein Csh2